MSKESSVWLEVGADLNEASSEVFLERVEDFKNEACAKLIEGVVSAKQLELVFQHATRPDIIASAIEGFVDTGPDKETARSVIKCVPEDGLPSACSDAVLLLFDYILDDNMKAHKHNYARHVMRGHGKQLVLYNHPAWR